MKKILDKGQIAETMTWIVASIVIIVILLATLSISGLSDIAEKVGLDKKINSNTEGDMLITKSFIGYLSTKEDGDIVYENLKEKKGYPEESENFNNFEENLAEKIFFNLYEEYTPSFFWMGIVSNDLIYDKEKRAGQGIPVSNNDFGSRIKVNSFVRLFYDNIELNDKSVLEIILIRGTK